MIACCYSSFYFFLIIFSLLSLCFTYERSSIDSSIIDDENKIELNNNNNDEYIDEYKYNKASYKHEQTLLANIYTPSRNYISMHDDRIHPSNFSYFTFKNLGTYRFILISLRGDADLYISTRHKHVTYDNYEYSSCTCGIDEILIDSYMKRPIYIGVYGYSQFQVSHYRLLIELVDSTIPLDETFFEQSKNDKSYSNTHEQHASQIDSQSPRIIVEGEQKGLHLLWTVLKWLFQIAIELLEALS